MKLYLRFFGGSVLLSLNLACNAPNRSEDVKPVVAPTENLVSINTMPSPPLLNRDTVSGLIKKGNQLLTQHPDSALLLYQKALAHSQQLRFRHGIARSLICIARYWYEYQADYEQARQYFMRSIPYCIPMQKENRPIISAATLYIGNTYLMQSRYDSAIYWLERSLSFTEKNRPTDTQSLVAINQNIGIALVRSAENVTPNFDRALYYLSKSLQLSRQQSQNKLGLASSYGNMGSLYYTKNEHDSALRYYNLALQLYNQFGKNKDKQLIYSSIAGLFIQQYKLDTAMLYLDSAYRSDPAHALNDPSFQQNSAAYYFSSGQYEKALPYYKQNLEKAIKEKRIYMQMNCTKALANLYDSINNPAKAYYYQSRYLELLQKNYDAQTADAINQTEIKYRTAQKDKELLRKQFHISRQQNKIQQLSLLIGTSVMALLVLGGLMYRRQQKATISQLKASLAGEEKERIRLASELHDGIVSRLTYTKMRFDALGPIPTEQSVDAEEFRDALQHLDQSIVDLRAASQNMLPSALKTVGLATALSIYCQNIKQSLPLDLSFRLEGQIPPLDHETELNIYRIVQELLHNIIKHAQATEASVVVTFTGNHLHICIQDNGIGMPEQIVALNQGVGLYNLSNRVKVLGGRMHISNQNGTRIAIDSDIKLPQV